MSIMTTYLMRNILTITLIVMLVLLGLAGLFEFIGQLDNTEGDYGTPRLCCLLPYDCRSCLSKCCRLGF